MTLMNTKQFILNGDDGNTSQGRSTIHTHTAVIIIVIITQASKRHDLILFNETKQRTI